MRPHGRRSSGGRCRRVHSRDPEFSCFVVASLPKGKPRDETTAEREFLRHSRLGVVVSSSWLEVQYAQPFVTNAVLKRLAPVVLRDDSKILTYGRLRCFLQ